MIKTTQSERNVIYYSTFTCFQWLPLFEHTSIYDTFYKWFDYLKKYDNKVVGFVIMPNHFHALLYITDKSPNINKIVGNAKRFLAYEIVSRLEEEQDKELLDRLNQGVSPKDRKRGKLHQVFEPSSDIKICVTPKFLVQKLKYIHRNPVSGKWKLANSFLEYPHSSAHFYATGEPIPYAVTDYRTIPYVGDMMSAYIGRKWK